MPGYSCLFLEEILLKPKCTEDIQFVIKCSVEAYKHSYHFLDSLLIILDFRSKCKYALFNKNTVAIVEKTNKEY